MAFQVSPGVQVKEIDLSNVVPAVSSTRGAFAGIFQWGPVDEVKTVSDGQQLVDEFYQPANTDAGAEDFYSAESFLKYGSSLSVVRISNTGLFSANASGNGATGDWARPLVMNWDWRGCQMTRWTRSPRRKGTT